MKRPQPGEEPPAGPQRPSPGSVSGTNTLAELFHIELEQQTAALASHLLELDKGNSRPETLQELMRAAHSLKGAARIVNSRSVARIAHQMEECFVLAQHGALTLERTDIDALLKIVDFLSEQKAKASPDREDPSSAKVVAYLASMERITSRAAAKDKTPQPLPAVHPARPSPQKTVHTDLHPTVHTPDRYLRFATESLNRLLGLASESLVESRWLRPFADSLQHLSAQHAQLGKTVERLRLADTDRAVRAELESLTLQLQAARQALARRLQELETFDQRSANRSRGLYVEVLRARMRPLSDLSRRLPRMVRDLARVLGKNVRLEIFGESTQVDREVLERIEAPIVHLLRNAVDHGCESADARQHAGKPAECVIRVEARHNGGTLLLRVADDGRGVDPVLLRQKVVEKGLADPAQVRMLTDTQLLDYLFVPGFTIREKATEISGRGIGLDLVHTAVRNLRGSIRVVNRPARGMEFQLQLPLTISVIRALLVEIDGEPYAVPLGRITRVARLTPKQVESIQGIPHYRHLGRHITLAHGWKVLGCNPPAKSSEDWRVIILGETQPRHGLVVDKFIGESELLVQPLDPRLGKVRDVTAAALMNDGRPVLILDVQEISRSIQRLGELGRLVE